MRMQKRNKQKGLTIVETLLAIIIGVIILVAAFYLYGNARDSARINTYIEDLSDQVTQAENLYSPNMKHIPITTIQITDLGVAHTIDPYGNPYIANLNITKGTGTSGATATLTVSGGATSGRSAPSGLCRKLAMFASSMIDSGLLQPTGNTINCSSAGDTYNFTLNLE